MMTRDIDIENKQSECYYLDKLEAKKHCKHKRVFGKR